MNLGVKIGKLQLKYPIVTASGTFGFGEELSSLVDFSSLGALVTKTITLKSRRGNPPPRIREVECGVLNSIGLDNPGVEGFLKNKLPKIKKLGVPFIVSVGGYSPSEYVEVVKVLDRVKGIKAIEINLSCPNLRQKKMFSQSARLTFKITDSLRRITKKTLIVKLTGEVEDIRKIAKSAEYGGADALSLVNTFFAMGVDVDTKKPFLGRVYGGYSGKGIKPLSLYRVWECAKVVKIPIIGGGGIDNYRDAIEFFLVGAKVISLGTINLVNPNAAKSILNGIIKYMQKNKIKDINELVGGLVA
ncbi:MAG: dihydroorotate dehydrogenase [Candidatus Omnitrophota bacterium]|nr:MAG: dihydroorotate dehydrogenase [Candidatus Omnitrophota bacterium]